MTHYLFLLQRNLGLSESLRMYWGDNRNPLNIYLFLLVNRYLPRKKYPLYILKQLRDYLHLQQELPFLLNNRYLLNTYQAYSTILLQNQSDLLLCRCDKNCQQDTINLGISYLLNDKCSLENTLQVVSWLKNNNNYQMGTFRILARYCQAGRSLVSILKDDLNLFCHINSPEDNLKRYLTNNNAQRYTLTSRISLKSPAYQFELPKKQFNRIQHHLGMVMGQYNFRKLLELKLYLFCSNGRQGKLSCCQHLIDFVGQKTQFLQGNSILQGTPLTRLGCSLNFSSTCILRDMPIPQCFLCLGSMFLLCKPYMQELQYHSCKNPEGILKAQIFMLYCKSSMFPTDKLFFLKLCKYIHSGIYSL